MQLWKILGLAALAAAIIAYYQLKSEKPNTLPAIAMTQIIEHHTLDTVRQGFVEGLSSAGYVDGKTVQLVYENAHGNMTTAVQIANKFSAQHPRIMVAFSTQSAQVLMPVSQSLQIPLVFTAVTDPKAARLTEAPLVTGISDFMPALPQLKLMKALIPSLKTLGVIHNPSEVNSVSYLKHVEEEAKAMGITLVYAAVTKTSDAIGATKSLIGKVEAIYFPNDNTAMAAAQTIAQIGHQHETPVFANDSASVERGCVAALAYDRISMGRQTAEIVAKILNGTKLSELPITTDTPMVVAFNKHSINQLTLNPDGWIQDNAHVKIEWTDGNSKSPQ